MRKSSVRAFFLAAVLAAAAPSPSPAQDFFKVDQSAMLPGIQQPAEKPRLTPAHYVAMLFHRMTGKPLDFETWAKQTKKYQDASEFEQMSLVDETANEIRKQYNLISLQDPLIVEYKVQLGKYSEKNEGYLVRNFDERTHFSFTHLNENYAVVPKRISEKQFLSVDAASAANIEKNLADYREITLQMTLLPQYGDSTSPVEIDGSAHWLMLADVVKMAIWDRNGAVLLWESVNEARKDEITDKLHDLYR